MFIVTRCSFISTFQPVLVLKCIMEDRLMGFVGDSVNKTIVHFDLDITKTKTVTWLDPIENVISAFNRDVSIVVLAKDKRNKLQSYLVNFETKENESVPLPQWFYKKSATAIFFADTTISVCDPDLTAHDVRPTCSQLIEKSAPGRSKYNGKQRQLLSSMKGWEYKYHGKVICSYPDQREPYFMNTCITDKHSNKSFILYLEDGSYATYMGNRYRKSFFGQKTLDHFMPVETNIDTTRSDKIRLATKFSEKQSVVMSLLGGDYLVESNGTHLHFNIISTTGRQIKAIAANQPNPNTLFLINSCVKPNPTEETPSPSQKGESTTLINYGHFTTTGSEKSREESLTTMNTATRTTSRHGNRTTIRSDTSKTSATSYESGSLTTMEIVKSRKESITTMNTGTRTTSSHGNQTTIRNDFPTTSVTSHKPGLENGNDLPGEYLAIIVLLGFTLLVVIVLVTMYVCKQKRNQQLPSSTSETTFSESEQIQYETTNLNSTEPVNHDELNTTHGSEREPALVVALPNNQVCLSVSNDVWPTSSATLSLSVTPTPEIDSSTIKSMSGIFAQASEVKHSIPVKQHKSTSKVETISTNIPSGSVHLLNPRANRSESDPVSLSQLPIQVLKRIWRHKIKRRKQANQEQKYEVD